MVYCGNIIVVRFCHDVVRFCHYVVRFYHYVTRFAGYLLCLDHDVLTCSFDMLCL